MDYRYVDSYVEFKRLVGVLNVVDLVDRELPLVSCSVFGLFNFRRLGELMSFVARNREYHIASCVEPDLKVNGVIDGLLVMGYYLADGDPHPGIVHDPRRIMDNVYLRDLNSARSKRWA
jgi:hypothetical protein